MLIPNPVDAVLALRQERGDRARLVTRRVLEGAHSPGCHVQLWQFHLAWRDSALKYSTPDRTECAAVL